MVVMGASRIGAALRTARLRAGWNREALAYHSGVSGAAIAQIESGRRKDLHLTTLAALANALGVSVDYLAGTRTAAPALFQHRVATYETDDAFLSAAHPFLSDGIDESHCLLAVTTPAKQALLRDSLGDDAAQVEFADWDDWYRSPRHALDRYGDYLSRKTEEGAVWLRVLGEAAWADKTEAQIAEWNRYESLVNLVFAPSPATVLCTYDERAFPANVIAVAHQTHPELVHGKESIASSAYQTPEDYLLSC
jgi:transcriptional regulator with XRE-family HTH domain